MKKEVKTNQKASKKLLVAGWIFALAGGVIGLVIAFTLRGKVKNEDGEKVYASWSFPLRDG